MDPDPSAALCEQLKNVSDQVWARSSESNLLQSIAVEDTVAMVKTNLPDGNTYLRNLLVEEIFTYRKLARVPGIVGNVTPPLLAAGPHGYSIANVILVTELVGLPVTMKDGSLYVGDEQLFSRDAQKLKESAMDSLRVLHNAKWRHNNIELRHVRAIRGDYGKWCTWWVDFSLAAKCETARCYDVEMQQCEDSFDPAYVGIIEVTESSDLADLFRCKTLPIEAPSMESIDDNEDEEDEG